MVKWCLWILKMSCAASDSSARLLPHGGMWSGEVGLYIYFVGLNFTVKSSQAYF